MSELKTLKDLRMLDNLKISIIQIQYELMNGIECKALESRQDIAMNRLNITGEDLK